MFKFRYLWNEDEDEKYEFTDEDLMIIKEIFRSILEIKQEDGRLEELKNDL